MSSTTVSAPDYVELVSFLVKPFLEFPDDLRVDCETRSNHSRVWVRLAFAKSDIGRVFGRGGRTIQAIRTVVEAAAQAAGQSVYLDIYGSRSEGNTKSTDSDRRPPRRRPAPTPNKRQE